MIDPSDKRQIIIGDRERYELNKELVEVFIAVDKNTPCFQYNSNNIRNDFPRLYELFNLLR